VAEAITIRPVLASTAITDQVAKVAIGVMARTATTAKKCMSLDRRINLSILLIPLVGIRTLSVSVLLSTYDLKYVGLYPLSASWRFADFINY
jgi:hypothetical protein